MLLGVLGGGWEGGNFQRSFLNMDGDPRNMDKWGTFKKIFCFRLGGVLARLDQGGLLEFINNHSPGLNCAAKMPPAKVAAGLAA